MGFRLLFPPTNQKEQLSSITQLVKALTLQNAKETRLEGWLWKHWDGWEALGHRACQRGGLKKTSLVLGLVSFVGGFCPHFTELEDQVFVHFLSKPTGLRQQQFKQSLFSKKKKETLSLSLQNLGKHRHQRDFFGFFDRSLQFWLRLVKKRSIVCKD